MSDFQRDIDLQRLNFRRGGAIIVDSTAATSGDWFAARWLTSGAFKAVTAADVDGTSDIASVDWSKGDIFYAHLTVVQLSSTDEIIQLYTM